MAPATVAQQVRDLPLGFSVARCRCVGFLPRREDGELTQVVGLAGGRGVKLQDDAPRSSVCRADDRRKMPGTEGRLASKRSTGCPPPVSSTTTVPRVHRDVVAQTCKVRRKRAVLTDHQGRELHKELRSLAPLRHDLGRAIVIAMTMAMSTVFGLRVPHHAHARCAHAHRHGRVPPVCRAGDRGHACQSMLSVPRGGQKGGKEIV